MYTLEDVYKTFPSGATEDYKILRAFERGKQEGGAKVKELEVQIEKMKCCGNCKNGELSAHEEPCPHCQRCFVSADVTDQENVSDKWELAND